jgi:hypothetical protein
MAAGAVGGKAPDSRTLDPWGERPARGRVLKQGHDHTGSRPFADRAPRIPYLDHPEEACLPEPSTRAAFLSPTTLDDVVP